MAATEHCWDCLIIGGGPAGLTAATYLCRFHRSCLVVDAGESRARWIPESNNCPGFPDGIRGPRLLQRLHQHAGSYGVTLEKGLVDRVSVDGGEFVVCAGARSWRARTVILASGIKDQLPPYAWVEQAIAQRALRLCAVCDAYEATDLRIGVYGRLDKLISHARFLRTFSAQVLLLPTDAGDEQDRQAAAAAGLPILPPGELEFDGRRIAHRARAGARTVLDAVYACLGSNTAAELVTAIGARVSEAGEIEVDRYQMTAVDGVYAIGDIVSGLNQIAVAFGHAAVAACHLHAGLPRTERDLIQPA
ncbi:NAD(P)/FAD-dependent oxidoreductase [Tahibacter harae]|uniref:NAD(P)/FAD-dependent oxidoreductase n=1 Tax=Tahibacter harae TaxID=2963937 RepID=A0ABT1QP98_9GAMM|nr:NAD(P)/FAD-dependent oxidoreductase [Tahibacter harae]MCQ4164099.1 NAD(P)/FAD-dependent oxidoreductase [Tahibacter harae]